VKTHRDGLKKPMQIYIKKNAINRPTGTFYIEDAWLTEITCWNTVACTDANLKIRYEYLPSTLPEIHIHFQLGSEK
jgi:hypothetical protein